MSDPPERSQDFLGDILKRIGEVMGERAGAATIRYAAHSEGHRIAEGFRPADLPRLLERLDAVVGQRTWLVDTGPPVRVEVDPQGIGSDTFGRSLLLGALEGAVSRVLGRPVEAHLTEPDGRWAIEMRGRGDD